MLEDNDDKLPMMDLGFVGGRLKVVEEEKRKLHSSQQPRPAPTDTSRSPQSTRRQPARLARNCAVRSPRVPLSPARSRSADAVAAPRSRFVSLCRRCKPVTC
ncbi:hypothetical protein WN943_000588 [Citrus x changshan-huyou]